MTRTTTNIIPIKVFKTKFYVGLQIRGFNRKDYCAAFRVHNTLGNGFQEVIYQRGLEIEFRNLQLNFAREFEMPIFYLNEKIGTRRVDFLVHDILSVELKAVIKIEDVHLAQAINYLEAYNLEIGLLINFGSKRMAFHRFSNKKFNSFAVKR